MARILVDITAHGYGHLAQTAPLLNALKKLRPDIEMTLRCGLARDVLHQFLDFPFDVACGPPDFGVRNRSSTEIDWGGTAEAYRELDRDWDRIVSEDCSFLEHFSPDLLIANTGFLSIEAAARAGIRSFQLASLDWVRILAGYSFGDLGGTRILERMRDAYGRAELRLCLSPGMPPFEGQAAIPLGTSARKGEDRRQDILEHLDLPKERKIIVFALGSGNSSPPKGSWQSFDDAVFVVPDRWPDMAGAVAAGSLPIPFIDVLASADVCVGKIGYGLVTEIVRNDVPLIYYSRADWAEDPVLIEWLERFVKTRRLADWSLDASSIGEVLERQAPRPSASPEFDAPEKFAALISKAIPINR